MSPPTSSPLADLCGERLRRRWTPGQPPRGQDEQSERSTTRPDEPRTGAPGLQDPDSADGTARKGMNETVPAPPFWPSTTESPAPPGLAGLIGPDADPHQLCAASMVTLLFRRRPLPLPATGEAAPTHLAIPAGGR